MNKRHGKNTKKTKEKKRKKKPLRFEKTKFCITMRKLFIAKARENLTKNRKRIFLLIAKNANRRNAEASKKLFFERNKTQKKRESKTPFKISFRKHNFVLT